MATISTDFTEASVTAWDSTIIESGILVTSLGTDRVSGLAIQAPPDADLWTLRHLELLRQGLGRMEPVLTGLRYDTGYFYLRFMAALGCPWVQVHIQSAGTASDVGGPAYDSANAQYSEEIDCRQARVHEVKVPLLGAGRYVAFLVPVVYDGAGNKILLDGQSGRPDYIAHYDLGA